MKLLCRLIGHRWWYTIGSYILGDVPRRCLRCNVIHNFKGGKWQ